MPPPPTANPLNLAELRRLLGSDASRFDADVMPVCDSSNSLLLARAEAGAPSGSVLVCAEQTAGRGRRGRSWIASSGSLAFSLLWRFPPGSPPPMGLSLAVGVAVARALEGLGAQGILLKWPNDVLNGGKKLSGILVELAQARERAFAVVIGIGLNLVLPEDFPDDIPACDLASLLPAQPSREAVLAVLLKELARALDDFACGGFSALRPDWLARHAHQHRRVILLDEQAPPLEGVCRGVAEDGALLLETPLGTRRILAGEVSLRPREAS